MELFDKKYVHFMWDDELRGKEGFFADDICELTNCVLSGDLHLAKVCKSLSLAFPFKDTNNNDWLFFYYDPNYFVKKAYAEGKQIQIKNGKTWYTIISNPEWFDDAEYRIKPDEPRRMTNRELARWLAQGKGQWNAKGTNAVSTSYSYGIDDKELPDNIMIRGWDEAEWHEPVIEEADK